MMSSTLTICEARPALALGECGSDDLALADLHLALEELEAAAVHEQLRRRRVDERRDDDLVGIAADVEHQAPWLARHGRLRAREARDRGVPRARGRTDPATLFE